MNGSQCWRLAAVLVFFNVKHGNRSQIVLLMMKVTTNAEQDPSARY